MTNKIVNYFLVILPFFPYPILDTVGWSVNVIRNTQGRRAYIILPLKEFKT